LERKPELLGSVLQEAIGLPITTRTCEHKGAQPRKRLISGQAKHRPWLQCPDCGHSRALKLADHPDCDSLPEFSETLCDEISERQSAAWREKHDQEQARKSREWWERYEAYLASPAWRRRRAKVMRRAGGICEACLEAEAVQVHHTTYKHVQNEPLWELRAVCLACHEQITALDRKESA
jgi:hypothetical protein